MKLLFLSYHYPGPLSPLAAWLANKGHEILFASNRGGNPHFHTPQGIQRVILKRFTPAAGQNSALDSLANAVQAARYAEKSFQAIRASGFVPEIVFSASSGGAALSLPTVFPDTYWVNFLEPVSENDGVCHVPTLALQILQAQLSYVFYPSQKKLFPHLSFHSLKCFPMLVNPELFLLSECSSGNGVALLHGYQPGGSFLQDICAANSPRLAILAENPAAARAYAGLASQDFKIELAGSEQEYGKIFQQAALALFRKPCERMVQAMACGCPTFADASIPEEDLPPGIRRIAGGSAMLARLLENAEDLSDYGRLCREIALKYCEADSVLPVWFSKLCRRAENWRKKKGGRQLESVC